MQDSDDHMNDSLDSDRGLHYIEDDSRRFTSISREPQCQTSPTSKNNCPGKTNFLTQFPVLQHRGDVHVTSRWYRMAIPWY